MLPPFELLQEVHPTGCLTVDYPHEWFRELREKAPIFFHEEEKGPGFWCITKHADLRHISRSPGLFSSEVGGTQMRDPTAEERELAAGDAGGAQLAALNLTGADSASDGGQFNFPIMLNMDPPNHVKFRRVVQRSFTPRYVGQQEAHIRELAKRIVDVVAHTGEAEFVTQLAAELPLQVICEMMGVPYEERKEIFEITNRMIGADDPELGSEDRQRAGGAFVEMFMHAMKVANQYKENPTDNLSSKLLTHEVEGEKLNEIEYCAFFLLLCVAGNETTRTVTSNGFDLLMRHPDQLQRLVDEPALIPSAVEEILRFAPAVHHFRRTALSDTEIRGQKIREGDKLVMWYPSVNRDEEVFDEPDRFDITRSPNNHLSFGIGEHFCLGAALARLELIAIFEEMIPRLRDPKHAAPLRRLRSNFINGVKEMQITFTPEA